MCSKLPDYSNKISSGWKRGGMKEKVLISSFSICENKEMIGSHSSNDIVIEHILFYVFFFKHEDK